MLPDALLYLFYFLFLYHFFLSFHEFCFDDLVVIILFFLIQEDASGNTHPH